MLKFMREYSSHKQFIKKGHYQMRQKTKVLLAGEEQNFSAACADLLRQKGFDVTCIKKDGQLLLQELAAGKPDILLMDAFLAGVDALGVLGQMQENGQKQTCSVIVACPAEHPLLESELLAAGADYYFLKPVDPVVAAERIAQLSQWHARRAMPPFARGESDSLAPGETLAIDLGKDVTFPVEVVVYDPLRMILLYRQKVQRTEVTRPAGWHLPLSGPDEGVKLDLDPPPDPEPEPAPAEDSDFELDLGPEPDDGPFE